MKNSSKLFQMILIFALLFGIGAVGGYLFLTSDVNSGKREPKTEPVPQETEFAFIKVYYPFEGRLQMEERKVEAAVSRMDIAEVTLKEYLKGPAGARKSYIPAGVKLLGIYLGSDGILYVDLSDEFRSDFHGDALEEFLLLRGLYESLHSNVYNVEGVKILVEGEELETLGGHISLSAPLGEAVSQTMAEEDEGF